MTEEITLKLRISKNLLNSSEKTIFFLTDMFCYSGGKNSFTSYFIVSMISLLKCFLFSKMFKKMLRL